MGLEETAKKKQSEKRVNDLLSLSLQDLKDKTMLEDHSLEQLIQNVDESWDDYKKKYKDSLEIVMPPVDTIGQNILTSATLMNALEQRNQLMNMEFDINMIADLKEAISNVQTVVSVGPACQQVKVGDIVTINLMDFRRVMNPNSVHSQEVFELPIEKINDRTYLFMHERNLKFIHHKK